MCINPCKYQQCIARAIAMLPFVMLIGGCGGSSKVDDEFMRQMNETKTQSSASQVKKAALQLSLTLDKDAKIPTEIASLPIFKKEGDAFISCTRLESGNGLFFRQGGGFASQGIIVCFSDDTLTNTLLRGTIIRWEGGVFFWADWRVFHGLPKSDLVLRRE